MLTLSGMVVVFGACAWFGHTLPHAHLAMRYNMPYANLTMRCRVSRLGRSPWVHHDRVPCALPPMHNILYSHGYVYRLSASLQLGCAMVVPCALI